MKKLALIFLLSVLSLFTFAQDYRGYNIEALDYMIAHDAFVIGADTLYNTTQLSGLDTTLVTLDYLTAIIDTVDGRIDSISGILDSVINTTVAPTTTQSVHKIAHGLTVGEWIDKDYSLAQGDTTLHSDVIGIVSEVVSVDSFVYQFSGEYTAGTWTDGSNYFLSTTVAGAATTTDIYSENEVRVYLGSGNSDGLLIDIDVGVVITVYDYSGGGGGGETTSYLYEDYLIADENVIDVGFTLTDATLVFFNGDALKSNNWSYSGQVLTLTQTIYGNDILIVSTGGNASDYFDTELTASQNNIDVGFTLTATSLIFYNGDILHSDRWSGVGTSTLTLDLSTYEYDNLIVKN